MKAYGSQAWVVLAGFSLMLCISMSLPLYGGSVVYTQMAVELGWNKQTLGMLVAVNMLANALVGPFAARSVGRLGFRKSLMFGSGMMIVAGIWLASWVSLPWQALIAYSLLMGLVGAFGLIPCQAGVAAWFAEGRTMALSILYAAMGVASFLIVSMVSGVVASSGWRSGWWVFAAAGVVGLLISVFVIRNPPSDMPQGELMPGPPPPGGPPSAARDCTFAEALRSPLLWMVTVSMLTVAAGQGFMLAHSQVHLREMGITPAAAASTMSLLSIFMVAGNMGFGFFAPRLELRRAYVLAIVCFLAGFLVLAKVNTLPLLYAYAVVTGIGFGGAQVGMMAILGHYWGTKVFPALTAMGMIIQTIGGSIVSIAAGAYFDSHHTYLPVLYSIVAINALAAVILFAMSSPRPRSELNPSSV